MNMNLTLAQAKEHGVDYLALLAMANSAKSKNDVSLEAWKFKYDWCEMVHGCNFMDVLNGRTEPKETVEQRIARRISNTHVRLMMYHKSSRKYYRELFTVPERIKNLIRAAEEKVEADRVRYEALPPAEKDKELEAALRDLAGPGFAAFGDPSSSTMKAAKRAGVKVIPRRF